MWEKWKKRIARLFFKEVEEEEEIERKPRDINSIHDYHVHTKITHKYPNRASFRFPVIPDNPKQKNIDKPAFERKQSNIDTPAYARKWNESEGSSIQQRTNKNESNISKPKAADPNRKGNTPVTQGTTAGRSKPETEQKKKPTVEKKPFQPTDVPSPIYGFQNREQEQELADVPAYLRKQRENSEAEIAADISTDESNTTLQKEDAVFPGEADSETLPLVEYPNDQSGQEHDLPLKESAGGTDSEYGFQVKSEENEETLPDNAEQVDQETLTASDCAKDQPEQERDHSSKESTEVTDSEDDFSVTNEENKVSEQIAEANTTENAKNKENPVHSTKKQRTGKKHPSKQGQKDNQQTNQTIPFNVMMSANDKRRYRERRQSSRNHKDMGSNKTTIPYYLLNDPDPKNSQDQLWVSNQQELLEKTLKYFHVKAKVVRATQGPSVTRFEVQPEMGVKVSKIKNLSDDLKLNLAAEDIRIEAPIPGKNAVGIEIPNPEAQMVGLQEIFATEAFQNNPSSLTIALGLTIEGSPSVTTIKKMPHGLIAGATGSGKSVCINTILISLIYKASHHDVKFLLIDPKMVELAPFNNIPHLVAPVITDVKAATQALKWAVKEMEDRYEKFVEEGVRDVERYNQKMVKQNRLDEKMPFLVIVIDELSDLMMMAPQDVEDSICRIAQKARACGIHLLLATQRPSVDVITGLIKANIPTRIAFSVSSQVDSRTIIDTNGAENLLGKGDMLFIENGAGKSVRLQGAFVSDDEIERVTRYARSIAPVDYAFEQNDLLEQVAVDDDDEDDLLEQAIAFVVEQNSASTSLLQRHFKIGYNRAARLMDTMETKGIIAQQNGSKPREVLVSSSQLSDQN